MTTESVFEMSNKYIRAMNALHKTERRLLGMLLSGPDHPDLKEEATRYANMVVRATLARQRIMGAYPQLAVGGGLEHPHPLHRS